MQKLSKIPYLLILGVLFLFGVASDTGADIKDSIPIFDFHLSLDTPKDNGVRLHSLVGNSNSELLFSETEEEKDKEEEEEKDSKNKKISFNASIANFWNNRFPNAVYNSICFSIPFRAKKYLLFHSLKIDC